MRLDLILYHQPGIERNMGSETNHFENDDENVADVKKSNEKRPSFIENHEENIFKTLNFGNDFQHNNHEYFNEATIQELEEKPKLCDKNDNIICNSAMTLNPLNVQDQKSNLNEQIFQDHNSFKNPDIISACEVKPEDPYRGSVRLVRLQAASNNSTEPLNNAGCDVTLPNSSGVIPAHLLGEYQFVTHRTVPLKQQIYVSANSDENSQMPDATFHSMLQHDISSSTDTSNALYEHIVFSNSENSVSDFSIPRIDRVESSPSPDITSSTWIMNSVNNNDSNGTSIRENESSVLQYHQNSQETSENSQSSANLSEIPDTQQMQRFITADNQVVYGYKDPNGEFHFFCPAMNERESHNEKERKRRSRVSDACSALRKLVPGLSDKTDKATVFEQAARYLKFYRDKFGTQFDQV
ncbi:BHLH domain-containing protein [Trichonephila inaurata madagascariensis]|uniref:BHLH domain-containing protein n=1 Tax=Trichonephila inaurata madagascariensis TaxID=2747483 RepID=A0A8X6XW18_9ARAC|nr:BHLH domain-containing protein [Trichonephila inaurata madagascariensis]